MREEFPARLNSLISEKHSGGWKGGWIWGRLQLEFEELQPDELNAIAAALGYKYGYNQLAKTMWEEDWQATKPSWERMQREKALKQAENERLNALIHANERIEREKALLKQAENERLNALIRAKQSPSQPKQSLTEVERVLISIIFRMPPEQQLQLLDAFLDRHIL
jgi:hypothetical protein